MQHAARKNKPSDPQVAVSTPSIAAGGTATVQASVTVPTAWTYSAHAYVVIYSVRSHRDLHSFPTRRSSDLVTAPVALQPDLTPQSISLSSNSLSTGGSETVTVVV